MGRSQYKIYREEHPHFITSSVVGNVPVFGIPEAAQIVLEGLRFLCNKRAVRLYAYVIMEDHLHAILQGDDLAVKIGRFKSYSARKTIDLLQERRSTRRLRHFQIFKHQPKSDRMHQLWQEGFHPKEMVGDAMMRQKIEYIHNNPVKRGYVDEPHHWRYSSARNYRGMEALIPVDCFKGRAE